eukprot:2250023-Amphidinium_carterae.2
MLWELLEEYFGTFSAAIFTMTNLAAMQEYELVLRSVYEHQGGVVKSMCSTISYLLVLLMLYVAVLLFGVAYAIIYVIITQTCDTLHEGKADGEQDSFSQQQQQEPLATRKAVLWA